MSSSLSLTPASPSFESIAEQFSLLPDGDEQLKFLIQLGNRLPPLDRSEQVEENLVRGCVSSVWLLCEPREHGGETTLHFRGRSDAQIVSGLVAIVLSRYAGMSPEAILSVAPDSILDDFGLQSQLSPGRRNGLSAMVAKIRRFAVEAMDANR